MLRGAIRLFSGSLLGKLLGVVREALLAFLFGTSAVVAASRVSQTALLSPLNLLTSDALSGAYLPLAARVAQEDQRAALGLYRSLRLVFVVLGVCCIPLAYIGGDAWVRFLTPGFDADAQNLAVGMLMAMAWGAPAYLYFNMLCYLDMTHKAFWLSSVRATGQSVGLIAGVVAAYLMGIPSLLAWGFSVAYIVMSVMGMVYARRRGYFHGLRDARVRDSWPLVRLFLQRFGTLFWLPLIALTLLSTERMVASNLGVAAVASTDYARLITDTGVLLLATPLGLASLPILATATAEEAKRRMRTALDVMLMIAIPIAVLIATFSVPIVRLLFQRGEFGAESTYVTAAILSGMAIGLWAQLPVYFLVKAMNALDRYLSSVLVMAGGALVAIAFRPLLVDWLGGFGIGAAASCGAIVSLLLAASFSRLWRPVLKWAVVAVAPAIGTYALGTQLTGAQPWIAIAAATGCGALWLLWYWIVPASRVTLYDFVAALRHARRGPGLTPGKGPE